MTDRCLVQVGDGEAVVTVSVSVGLGTAPTPKLEGATSPEWHVVTWWLEDDDRQEAEA